MKLSEDALLYLHHSARHRLREVLQVSHNVGYVVEFVLPRHGISRKERHGGAVFLVKFPLVALSVVL